jgi:cytochrome b involved in lipid metabolism
MKAHRQRQQHGFDDLRVVVPFASTSLSPPHEPDNSGLLSSQQVRPLEELDDSFGRRHQICGVCSCCHGSCCGESLGTDRDRRDGRMDIMMMNLMTIMTRTCHSCDCTKTYSTCEIARHNTEDSAWLVVGNDVFDVTKFLNQHPGGKESILRKSGGVVDCSKDFLFHSKNGRKLWRSCYIGRVQKCISERKHDEPDGSSLRSLLHGRLEEFFRGIMLRIQRETDL